VPFSCSICEQESTRICAFCTKDACAMHLCERCGSCSDCCECDVPLDQPEGTHVEVRHEHQRIVVSAEPLSSPEPVPEPVLASEPWPEPQSPDSPDESAEVPPFSRDPFTPEP